MKERYRNVGRVILFSSSLALLVSGVADAIDSQLFNPATEARGVDELRLSDFNPKSIGECEELAANERALLAFEPRRRMTVDRTHKVEAVLALGGLRSDVTFETPTTIVVVDARCEVKAELTGGDFRISPSGPQEQSFIGTGRLRWRWDVLPEHPGKDLALVLRLQATVVEADRTVPGPLILNESLIEVDAAPRSLWQSFDDWSRDVFGHPAVPIAVVPAIGATVVALKRRRDPNRKAQYNKKRPRPSSHSKRRRRRA